MPRLINGAHFRFCMQPAQAGRERSVKTLGINKTLIIRGVLLLPAPC